jgi:toluene monooxygenase system protein A
MCNLPIVGIPGPNWDVQDYSLEYEGRLYHFGSDVDRWCFEQDPARYKNHLNFIDRFLAGKIQPMDLGGGLEYMGLAPGEIGDDAHNYEWVKAYVDAIQEAA